MLLTDYTSFDEIRAALGVADDELADTQLNLPMYAEVLQMELEDIHVNLPTIYAATAPLVDAGTITTDQQRFLQAAHLFATYAVAKHLTTALPLFSPEQVTDGKAMLRRAQTDTPYQKVIDAINREYARFRGRLEQMFAVINSTATPAQVSKSYLSVVTPAADPITGS